MKLRQLRQRRIRAQLKPHQGWTAQRIIERAHKVLAKHALPHWPDDLMNAYMNEGAAWMQVFHSERSVDGLAELIGRPSDEPYTGKLFKGEIGRLESGYTITRIQPPRGA